MKFEVCHVHFFNVFNNSMMTEYFATQMVKICCSVSMGYFTVIIIVKICIIGVRLLYAALTILASVGFCHFSLQYAVTMYCVIDKHLHRYIFIIIITELLWRLLQSSSAKGALQNEST